MPLQVVHQRSRGFICVNAHPAGCARAVERQIEQVRRTPPPGGEGPRRALVIGSSTGYGLATRIALAWGFGAATVGVFFERPGAGKRTASAGWYNSAAFDRQAAAERLYAHSLNGDAFSEEIKQQTLDRIRADLGQVDLVVYSLAAPRRTDPRTGEVYQSVLKPIGAPFRGKTVDLSSGEVSAVSIEPASGGEVRQTVQVMGGEDWQLWIEGLLAEGLLAEGARTLAYSYIGPELTWPIYRDGAIGAAKKHLHETAGRLRAKLRDAVGGEAAIAVNKAVVTQASAAIPVVPLYMSLLFRVMKERGLHEGCIEQMLRLCSDHLAVGAPGRRDGEGLIRLDDQELRPDVQGAVSALWEQVTTENLEEISDIAGFRRDFNQLFGFEVEGVDYDQPVETEVEL